jgi:hypothetical protein
MSTGHRTATALAIAAIVTITGIVRASDRFVSRTGDDTGNTCSNPLAACLTITHAVAQSTASDVIKIAKATYPGAVTIDATTTLTLEGGWTPDFTVRDPIRNRSRVAGIVVIDAGAGETIDVTLDGLTVKSELDAAVSVMTAVDGAAQVVITRCVLERSPSGILANAFGSSTLDLEVTDSNLRKNAGVGGGMLVQGSGSSTVTARVIRSEIRGNGGRAVTVGQVNPATVDMEILDSVVRANHGVGLRLENAANVTVTNTAIANNRAGGGAGVSLVGPATLTAVNTTITKNRVAPGYDEAAGMLLALGASASLTNTIVWGNRGRLGPDDVLMLDTSGTLSATFSDIGARRTFGGTFVDSGGNIDADPVLRGVIPRPRLGSPVIDSGTCSGVPATDIDGDPRPSGPGCDMGADEVVP